MKEILSQRFVYAEIVPYKNYCKISDKENYLNNARYHDIYSDFDKLITVDQHGNDLKVITRSNLGKSILLKPRRKNRKTKFFHSEVETPILVNYGRDNITTYNPYVTTKDRHIKKHYGNCFSEIRVHTIDRSIRVRDNKVTIKVYKQTRRRDVNWIYFKKSSTIYSVTLDLTTGNFTTAEITNGNRRFRKNSFGNLNSLLTSHQIFGVSYSYLTSQNTPSGDKEHVINRLKNVFCDEEFSSAINSALGFTFPNYSKDKKVLIRLFVNKFVELKKIKVPNDFEHLLTKYYPTEKFLRKNDRKLMASILDYFGIKSKVTIKIIHNHPKMDFFVLYNLCKLFGRDFQKYIGNINEKIFDISYGTSPDQSRITSELLTKEHIVNSGTKLIIREEDKDVLLKLINSLNFSIERNFVNLILDHFNMIDKVREHDYDYSFKARDYKQLHNEHTELSKMVAAIQKGWVIEYKFNEEMVTEIEKPITVTINLYETDNPIYEHITFKPYLLKREEEYIEEGNFMHHCVASYSDKDRSVIISIRNDDMSDRITCEFDCQTGICIQARHFCNAEPPGDMVLALDDLKEKVKYYSRMGMLHAKEKIKVPLMINGKEIKPELVQPTLRDYLFLNPPNF